MACGMGTCVTGHFAPSPWGPSGTMGQGWVPRSQTLVIFPSFWDSGVRPRGSPVCVGRVCECARVCVQRAREMALRWHCRSWGEGLACSPTPLSSLCPAPLSTCSPRTWPADPPGTLTLPGHPASGTGSLSRAVQDMQSVLPPAQLPGTVLACFVSVTVYVTCGLEAFRSSSAKHGRGGVPIPRPPRRGQSGCIPSPTPDQGPLSPTGGSGGPRKR